LGAAVAGLFGGFRALLPIYIVVFGVLFIMEGLYRTRHVLILAFTFVVLATVMIYTTPKLPYSVQRALSFLPIEVDYAAMADAQHSTEWRLEMWQQVLPDVPKYLFRGKGYGIDPQDLYLAQQSMVRGLAKSSEISWITGKYHNGLLSLVIPFGIYGLLAFGWFVVAAWRMLYRNHLAGDPRLKTVNTFLLVYFAVKLVLFATVFGSVEDELFFFTGVVGLSLCLNGGAKQESKGAEAPFEALELPTEVRY
jgi:O-antigen ligase